MEKARLTKQPIKVVVRTGIAANHVISTIKPDAPVVIDGHRYEKSEDALVKIGADRIVTKGYGWSHRDYNENESSDHR